MRICLLIDGLGGGGAERQTAIMAAELRRRGHDVDLVTYRPVNEYEEFLARHDVKHVCIREVGKLRLARIKALTRHFRQRQFDVVHCVKGNASLWGRIAARRAKIPCVFAGYRIAYPSEMGSRFLQRRLTRGTAGWIVNAQCVKDYIIGEIRLDLDRVFVVPNGLLEGQYASELTRSQARDKLGLAQDAWVCAMLAGLRPEKNHEMLLRVVKRVCKDQEMGAVFLIAGGGDRREQLEGMARQMGVLDHVRFLGRRSDTPDILAAIDVLVHTSNAEGLPNALLEAGAAGRPCVCTDAGDSAVVVRDGRTGFVVTLDDDAAFADRLIQLLHAPDLRKQMGQAAMAYVRPTFSVEALGDRLLEVYQRGLGGESAARPLSR